MQVEMGTWFVREGPFKNSPEDMGGDYNGYVVIHKSHPFFGMDYNDVPIEVHGGITFGGGAASIGWGELKEEYRNEDYWVYGFDTVHYMDTRAKWPKEKVEKETFRFYTNFYDEYIKNIKSKDEHDNGVYSGGAVQKDNDG